MAGTGCRDNSLYYNTERNINNNNLDSRRRRRRSSSIGW